MVIKDSLSDMAKCCLETPAKIKRMFRRTMSRTGLASSIGTPFRLGNGFSWIEIIVPANKSARGTGNGVSPCGSYHHRTGPARSKAVFHPGDLFHSVVIVWGSQTTYYSRYMCLRVCLTLCSLKFGVLYSHRGPWSTEEKCQIWSVTCAKVRFLKDADSRSLSGSVRCLSAFSGSSISCWNDGATLGDCEVLFVGNGVVTFGSG